MNQLGIAIPCYNELHNLKELVPKLQDPGLSWVDFVLVDNGSSDDSFSYLCSLDLKKNIRFMRIENNEGYGNGILEGVKLLTNEYIGWTHADLQCDPQDLRKFQNHLVEGVDFLKGKRANRPFLDRFFTAGMSFIVSVVFQKQFRDINAQPTIIRRSIFLLMNELPKDFGLDLAVYLKAMKTGNRVQRESVKFGPRRWGSSHWNTGVLARWKFVKRTLKLAWNIRSGQV